MSEIDHDGEAYVYRQVADAIRRDIVSGRRQPGRPLPSEQHLVQEFGVSRDTIRRAVALLAGLGLVRTVPGRGTFVRAIDVTVIPMEPGMRIFTRPATKAELERLEIEVGVWVLVVEHRDGEVEVLAGDGSEICVQE